jgi:single-strand DNA-binding protein
MLNFINNVIFEGEVSKEPENKTTAKGVNVCNFTVVNKEYFQKEGEEKSHSTFVECEAWGNLASFCVKELKQGKEVRIFGRLKTSFWKAPDGHSRSKLLIQVINVDLGGE